MIFYLEGKSEWKIYFSQLWPLFLGNYVFSRYINGGNHIMGNYVFSCYIYGGNYILVNYDFSRYINGGNYIMGSYVFSATSMEVIMSW